MTFSAHWLPWLAALDGAMLAGIGFLLVRGVHWLLVRRRQRSRGRGSVERSSPLIMLASSLVAYILCSPSAPDGVPQ